MSSNNKCCACQKTVYPMEKQNFGSLLFHKACFKCSVCQVRLRPEVTKAQESTGKIFCERDWNESGLGGIGIKSTAGIDDMRIANAKKAEAIKKDATMSNTSEVRGAAAGQGKNSQQSL